MCTIFATKNDEYEEENISSELWQEICWSVINAYFDEKGLVQQQLNSFNEFIETSIEHIVEKSNQIKIERSQYAKENDKYFLKFGQVYITKPIQWEKEDTESSIMPNEARLRNLTYSAALYIDIIKTTLRDNVVRATTLHEKIYIGKIPIMVRSKYCLLHGLSDPDLIEKNECPLDPGGYFIINGLEKVLIIQERIATNTVYVFRMKSDKYSYRAEIKSCVEYSSRPASTLWVNMKYVNTKNCNISECIVAIIPYVKQEIPIIIVFRAL